MARRIAVIGAGPNGLSIAAHLNARGLQPMVFGRPMAFWRDSMPAGMRLKTDGFACNLSEPSGRFTLKAFAQARNLPYADSDRPVELETFVAYGEAFQQAFAPQVDPRYVRLLTREGEAYRLELEDGARFEASDVVIAAGLAAFAHIPSPLARLSRQRLSHSSAVADPTRFGGQRVVVVGAGASAADLAASLIKAGAEATIVCRDREFKFGDGGGARPWLGGLKAPDSPLGPGWARSAVTRFPQAFAYLPDNVRVYVVDNMLGPAPAWFSRPELMGRARILPGREILGGRETGGGVEVELGRVGAQIEYLSADHVIAATGYRLDLNRLSFLSADLLGRVDQLEGSPRLASNFECSLPGLYFAGALSAYTFGPMMRFLCGAEFAAPRIAAAIAAEAKAPERAPVVAGSRVRVARL